MKRISLIVSVFMLTLMACSGTDVEKYVKPQPKGQTTEQAIVYKDQAKALWNLINQYYLIKSGPYQGLFLENYPAQSGDPGHTFLWGYVGLMSGSALLHQMGNDVGYAKLIDGFDRYYSAAGKVAVGGYSSATTGKVGSGTRFYDDNAIAGLEFITAYKLLKDSKYLDKCRQIVAFLKTGEDNINGTALWWNEDQKNLSGNGDSNKPTCANGYACNFLLKYYQICPAGEKADVLAFAKRLYDWLHTNLRDPEDNTYWNDMQVNKSINKTKWTYNSGVMVSNGVQLYKITGEQRYLTEAVETAEGAYNYFVRPRGSMALAYPNTDPWFNTKLLGAYLEILPYHKAATKYVDTYVNFMANGYRKARLENGFYYEDWTGQEVRRAASLLNQAAALESLGLIAFYKNEVK